MLETQLLKVLTDHYSDKFEKFYSRTDIVNGWSKIKKSPFLLSNTSPHGLMNLLTIDSEYNAVEVTSFKTIEDGKVKLTRDVDVLENIFISSEPKNIAKVSLLLEILISKNFESTINFSSDESILKSYFETTNFFEADKNNIHFLTLKTIENPKTNVISFYDSPIMSCLEIFHSLSIQIDFVKNGREKFIKQIPVCLKQLMFIEEMRQFVLKNYQHVTGDDILKVLGPEEKNIDFCFNST